MLDKRQQELAIERLINRIQQLDTFILETIGKRVKQIGDFNTAELNQAKQMLKYGKDLDSIKRALTKTTGLNLQDIQKIMEAEAKVNQSFAQQFYEARGLEFIPYTNNQELQRQVRAIAQITMNEYANLSRTTAIGYMIKDVNGDITFNNISQAYQNTIDRAVLSVSQGKQPYQEAIKDALEQLAGSGLVQYKSGKTKRLDSAVRMNMLEGMRTLSNELQNQFGREYGADGIEISVHTNPADDHAEVQGRQFSFEEYKKLQNGEVAQDYQGNKYELGKSKNGSFRPISTLNCYHYIFNIVLGVNNPEYTDKELKTIIKENEKGFTFEGKHYTNYEGTQLQRQIELAIRKEKDKQIMGRACENKEMVAEAQKRITQLTYKYNELNNISGLPSQIQRMRVKGYRRVNVDRM